MESSTVPPLNDSSLGSRDQTRLEVGNDIRLMGYHASPEPQAQESNRSNRSDPSSRKEWEESTISVNHQLENDKKLQMLGDHETLRSKAQESKRSNSLDPPPPEKLAESTDSTDQALREATQRGEFLGDDDPEDPLNWSVWKKTYHSLSVSFYCFCV